MALPVQGGERHGGGSGAGRVVGPLLLAVAALMVLGAVFWVFGREDGTTPLEEDAVAAAPSGTPRLTSGQSTESSAEPSETPRPSRRPLTLTDATASPTPRPTAAPTPTPERTTAPTPAATEPPPPPAPEFAATVQVCRSITGSSCDAEVRRIGPGDDDVVVLLAVLTNARAGDVIGFEVSGRDGTIDAGSIVIEGGGNGYAFVEFGTGGLRSGDYVVIATRNGDGVARTAFVKRGGGG